MTAQQVFSMDQNDVDPYSPTRLIAAADAKVGEGDIQGAELLFKEALLDWVDDAREGAGDPTKMKNAIADLWCGFATFYFNLKKYKSCLDAYENATQCPISGSCGKIWRAYANYCRVRNRPRSAQKVFLRALAGKNPSDKGAVTDETERFKLWNDFLSLTRETTNDPTLTIDALMTAVREEHTNAQQESNTDMTNQTNSQHSSDQTHQRPTKIQKLNHIENNFTTPALPGTSISTISSNDIRSLTSLPNPQNLVTFPSIPNQTQPMISMADQIQMETTKLKTLTQGNMPPEVLAVWLATDGDTPPSRPEPPLFGPSPPKLSDLSGKDILGSEMALRLLRILRNPKEGNIVLDVCKGCWAMTALKEQEVSKTIKYFEEKMNKELESLESSLAERLSVSSPALELTVKQTNDAERNQAKSTWNHRKQQLVNATSWEFRRLLAIQQNILTSANVPSFNGTSIDPAVIDLQSKVCSVMHSAFFLRNRIDEKTHIAMLSKQEEKLSKEAVTPPPRSINGSTETQFHALPQLRQKLPPPPFAQSGLPPPPPPHMYPGLQQTIYPPPPPIPPPIGVPPPALPPPPNTVPPVQQLPPHIQNQQSHFR